MKNSRASAPARKNPAGRSSRNSWRASLVPSCSSTIEDWLTATSARPTSSAPVPPRAPCSSSSTAGFPCRRRKSRPNTCCTSVGRTSGPWGRRSMPPSPERPPTGGSNPAAGIPRSPAGSIASSSASWSLTPPTAWAARNRFWKRSSGNPGRRSGAADSTSLFPNPPSWDETGSSPRCGKASIGRSPGDAPPESCF